MPYDSFHEPSPITVVSLHDDVTHVPLMSVLTHLEMMAKFKCCSGGNNNVMSS